MPWHLTEWLADGLQESSSLPESFQGSGELVPEKVLVQVKKIHCLNAGRTHVLFLMLKTASVMRRYRMNLVHFLIVRDQSHLQNCESEQGTGMNFTVNFYPGSTQQVRICFQDYFFLEPANHTQLRGCCSFSIYMCLAMRSLRDPTEANILMQSVLCRSWAPCFPSGDANTFL